LYLIIPDEAKALSGFFVFNIPVDKVNRIPNPIFNFKQRFL